MTRFRMMTDSDKLESIKNRIEIRLSVAENSIKELKENDPMEKWMEETIKEREFLIKNLNEILKDFCDV